MVAHAMYVHESAAMSVLSKTPVRTPVRTAAMPESSARAHKRRLREVRAPLLRCTRSVMSSPLERATGVAGDDVLASPVVGVVHFCVFSRERKPRGYWSPSREGTRFPN